MKKFWKFLKSNGGKIGIVISTIFTAISNSQVFGLNTINRLDNELSRFIGWIVLIFFLCLELLKWRNCYYELLKPTAILRIKEYGSEDKKLERGIWDSSYSEKLEIKTMSMVIDTFDTLYIEIFNTGKGEAIKVWSSIEWVDENNKIELIHQGRWHIASPNLNEKIEELQFVNFDSNGHPRKLHFACINKNGESNDFFGLCREMDGKEPWDLDQKYKLKKSRYLVKITLHGSHNLSQEFKYLITKKDGRLFIERGLTEVSEKVT